MKTARLLAVAMVTLASLPLMAQQVGVSAEQSGSASAAGANVNDSTNANANFRPGQTQANGAVNSMVTANGLHGAHAASSSAANAREHGAANEATQASAANYAQMRPVSGELMGKLDSKSARVGEPVVLKSTEKARTAGGMVIPKGSRLMGHVTEVQAHSKEHANSQMGIEFDRAELKSGQSFAIHSMIESVSPSASAMEAARMQDNDAFGSGAMGPGSMGSPMGGGAMAGGRTGGGLLGGAVDTMGSAARQQVGPGPGLTAGGALDATGNVAGDTTGALNTTGQVAGATPDTFNGVLHGAAGATGSLTPRVTGVPGVMLSGDAAGSASGVLSATKKNISLDSGTQMVVDIVAMGQ